MSQDDFAKYLGNVGLASIKRWELGQVQDKAMDKLIRDVRLQKPQADHKYTTHPTYTGLHCAICGRPEDDHAAREKAPE